MWGESLSAVIHSPMAVYTRRMIELERDKIKE